MKLIAVQIEPNVYRLDGWWKPHSEALLAAHALYETHRDRRACVVDAVGLRMLIEAGAAEEGKPK